jgi:hypothetical protein
MAEPSTIYFSSAEEAADFYEENAEKTAIISENPRSDGEASWVSGPPNPLQIALAVALSTYERGIWRITVWWDGDDKQECEIIEVDSIARLVSVHEAAGR